MSDANTAINTVSVDCPAKTNLTLHVGRPRSEWGGRHELDTIYCAVGVYDTVTTSRKKPGSGFSLNLEGAYLGDLASSGSDMRRNHAVLALFAMAEASGHEPDVALNIEKRIPVGAGMAGGSADAAATILALNTLWNLDWSIERLQQVAATLGADMPFCLTGGYARGTGFGEQIEQLSENSDAVLELTDQGFAGRLLVGAYQAELRTPEVYAMFDQIGAGATDNNHLQQASISLHPRSGQAIDEALQAGATHSCQPTMRHAPCSRHGNKAVASTASSPPRHRPIRLCISSRNSKVEVNRFLEKDSYMTQANDERAARKQYIRRRQKVVFTITGTILTIALVISLLFFFHVGGLGNVKSAAVQPNYGQQAPCAAQEQDGSKGKYVENRNITVRVLNGTEFAGFAQAVSSALQNREFNTQAAGNYTSSKVERTMIIFGKNAINQAYTVNSNFTDATMVMDDREDMLIDVVVGATFDNLQNQKKVPTAGKEIDSFEGCVTVDKMTDVQKAPEHDAV